MYALSTDNVVKEMSDLREEESLGEQAKGKHKKIDKYNSLPLFWRSFAYFVFRYILKGGFLEGKEGLIFAFIQGWLYRMLVDAKVLEEKMTYDLLTESGLGLEEKRELKTYIKVNWKIKL